MAHIIAARRLTSLLKSAASLCRYRQIFLKVFPKGNRKIPKRKLITNPSNTLEAKRPAGRHNGAVKDPKDKTFLGFNQENDIDEGLGRSLFEHVPGLEEKQLIVSYHYNKENGLSTVDIENRMRELGMNFESAN